MSNSYAWVGNALSGPAQDDTPIGKCVGAKGIGLVLKRAQDALVAKGLVTTRAVAQAQNLSTGHLVVDIVPGRVHAIRFAQDSERKAWFNNARNGVPIQTGDILVVVH